MKAALWVLGLLLIADVVFVGYFHVFRANYYFPNRYEDAIAADACALVAGIPVLASLVTLLIINYRKRK